ncbi:MAG: polymer-forming cytoskeletal protein [Acidobacteria bacterium]|nr:polymer-forming cytoskeletal protein [Acidobacteriota bacterium]
MESQSLSSAPEALKTRPSVQSSPAMPAVARSARGNSGGTTAIGKSLVLTGTLAGQNSDLTIGPNGNVKADIKARKITVFGRVTGKMFPAERIEILKTASVKGTVRTPRIVVEEGAVFHGNIESLGQEMNFPATRQKKPLIIRQESRS